MNTEGSYGLDMAWHITGNSINIMEGRREGGERKVGREGGVEGGRKRGKERKCHKMRESSLLSINAKWEKKKKK